jgi:hypothetical protein
MEKPGAPVPSRSADWCRGEKQSRPGNIIKEKVDLKNPSAEECFSR